MLGELPVPGSPTIWITVGQGPTALAGGAGGGCLDIFTLIYLFSPLSPSLWETARYRLKYCLNGPLNPKQPINHYFRHFCCHIRLSSLTEHFSTLNSIPIALYNQNARLRWLVPWLLVEVVTSLLVICSDIFSLSH